MSWSKARSAVGALVLTVLALAANGATGAIPDTAMAVGELASRLAQAIRGKGRRSVAVFAFRDSKSGTGADATGLAAKLAAALSAEKGLEVLDLTTSGAVDPKLAGRLGREAGADIVVVGTVAALPSSIALEIHLIESSSGDPVGDGQFFLATDAPVATSPAPPPASRDLLFETESYRIRVVGARNENRSGSTNVMVDLVVESLVRDGAGFFRKGAELRGIPPGRADSWHLVDGVGHRFEQRGADSAGICSPAFDAGVDLLPSGRVTSRFTFVAPGRIVLSRLKLVGAEMAPRPGRVITIEGIEVSEGSP
jgi:TolB-like protein